MKKSASTDWHRIPRTTVVLCIGNTFKFQHIKLYTVSRKWRVLQVTSPKGNNYHFGEVVETGSFAFTAAETGDYMACFRAPHHKPPQRISVEFEWRTGIDAKDWYKVARKGQMEVSTSPLLLALKCIQIRNIDSIQHAITDKSRNRHILYVHQCTSLLVFIVHFPLHGIAC